jgi:2-polyprenyl-6-methoxyphenol hydroxylase-like FAD-dependent oxidoreductase
MEAQNGGWLLHFKNGSTAYADLVVAADGANSKIRPYVTDIRAFYSGITMVEINIPGAATATPQIYKLLNGGKIMAFGNGKCLLGGQKGDGNIGFYASFKTGENWVADSGLNFADSTQLLTWFKTEYADWGDIWQELFENAAMPLIPRPVYCMPLNQTWQAQSNVTLLGDAAHVMPPFAGEGANTSMFDALELSEYLTTDKYLTIQEAIAAYETSMRERASAAARRSLDNGELMHSVGALEKMLGRGE